MTITLSKKTLDDIQLGQGTMEQKIANGEIKIEGDQQTFSNFVTLLDKFNFWFNRYDWVHFPGLVLAH